MVTIKDPSVSPPEKWRYFVKETNYHVIAGSYRILLNRIHQHCRGNGLTQPTEQEVIQYLCEHVTVDCRMGRESYENKFTRQNPENAAVPREEWPIWARTIALLAGPSDRGVGDTVARVIGPIGGDAFKVWYIKIFGFPCKCGIRQENWNGKYPFDIHFQVE